MSTRDDQSSFIVLALTLAACNVVVANGNAIGGDAGSQGGGATSASSTRSGTDVDASPDATIDASDDADASACEAATDPHACGCCFMVNGMVACPANVILPDSGVLTLPDCP